MAIRFSLNSISRDKLINCEYSSTNKGMDQQFNCEILKICRNDREIEEIKAIDTEETEELKEGGELDNEEYLQEFHCQHHPHHHHHNHRQYQDELSEHTLTHNNNNPTISITASSSPMKHCRQSPLINWFNDTSNYDYRQMKCEIPPTCDNPMLLSSENIPCYPIQQYITDSSSGYISSNTSLAMSTVASASSPSEGIQPSLCLTTTVSKIKQSVIEGETTTTTTTPQIPLISSIGQFTDVQNETVVYEKYLSQAYYPSPMTNDAHQSHKEYFNYAEFNLAHQTHGRDSRNTSPSGLSTFQPSQRLFRSNISNQQQQQQHYEQYKPSWRIDLTGGSASTTTATITSTSRHDIQLTRSLSEERDDEISLNESEGNTRLGKETNQYRLDRSTDVILSRDYSNYQMNNTFHASTISKSIHGYMNPEMMPNSLMNSINNRLFSLTHSGGYSTCSSSACSVCSPSAYTTTMTTITSSIAGTISSIEPSPTAPPQNTRQHFVESQFLKV
ncbi:unnamed protein product [Trichobilharzia regenti]|nr:unnamed protein product [Trichobilharzia regenti]